MGVEELPVVGDFVRKLQVQYNRGKDKQHIVVRSVLEGCVKGVPQGCLIGAVSYQLTLMSNSDSVRAKMPPEHRRALEQANSAPAKSLPMSMLAFSALFGVQYAFVEIFKHYRKKEDVWNQYASQTPHIQVFMARIVKHSKMEDQQPVTDLETCKARRPGTPYILPPCVGDTKLGSFASGATCMVRALCNTWRGGPAHSSPHRTTCSKPTAWTEALHRPFWIIQIEDTLLKSIPC
jgi:hypothetical protein